MPGSIDFIKGNQLDPGRPMVSIVVVTFQHAPYIRQCLDSILIQETDFPFEVIVGEDESTDGTREICIEYAEKYPNNIRLFLRSRKDVIYINGRPTGRYNFMENLKAARGKYIALCDGDDYWTDSRKLQKQVDFMDKSPSYSLAFTSCCVVNSDGEMIQEDKIEKPNRRYFSQIDVLKDLGPTSQTALFKRSALPKPFPNGFYKVANADTFLFYLVLRHGNAAYLPINTAAYRIQSTGIWQGISDELKIKGHISTYQEVLKVGGAHYTEVLKILEWKYYDFLCIQLNQRSYFEFSNYLFQYAEISWKKGFGNLIRKIWPFVKSFILSLLTDRKFG